MTNNRFLEQAVVYMPEEWRNALAAGELLPKRAEGAALFADISGFTPLSEKLALAYGLREGAERLPVHLDSIYDVLISEVSRYGGSVIDYAGDSIMCWFDHNGFRESGSRRACAAAVGIQLAMQELSSFSIPGAGTVPIGVKVSVASGPARRFLVGDPVIQRFAVMAGETMRRVADGERLAKPGEIWVDDATLDALGPQARTGRQERTDAGDRFHSLEALPQPYMPEPWPDLPAGALSEEQVRPWLLPQVVQKLQENLGEFLTELRPVVPLFLRFTGLDFENDPQVGKKLDELICGTQKVLRAHEGTLLQITIGDKGSYLYVVFGAPQAHENDARLAAAAALELNELCATFDGLEEIQIGMTMGTLRCGAYGARTRRAYGALGDDTNLAARLMMRAGPGEILVSNRVYQAITADRSPAASPFAFDPRPPVPLKGKAEPVAVFALRTGSIRQSVRLQEPAYALPMVGRQDELVHIETKIRQVLAGQGQVVGLCAEAGMGKSRLAAEVVRRANQVGMACFGGACQNDAANSPYFVWSAIWKAFFDFNPDAALKRQIRSATAVVEDYAPNRLESVPLLGPLLGIEIPDNDFTAELEPQYMRMALEALLVDCLKAAALEAGAEGSGMLILLEDLHWVDPASLDLLERAARACANLPVIFLLAYRPPEIQSQYEQRLAKLPNFTRIHLPELTGADAERAVRAKFAQLYPEWRGEVPKGLIRRVVEQAQGNPFYAEELLNYLNDQNADLRDPRAVAKLQLPASLQSLILSRVDRLTSQQQFTLKSAAVIGRAFRERVVSAMIQQEKLEIALGETLEALQHREIILRHEREEERRADEFQSLAGLEYIFKHIITLEVTYNSLLSTQRQLLHQMAAQAIEALFPNHLNELAATLAHHYELSELPDKALDYLEMAALRARSIYANDEAIHFYQKAIVQVQRLLETEPSQQWSSKEIELNEVMGDILMIAGRSEEAVTAFEYVLEKAAPQDGLRRARMHRKILRAQCVLHRYDGLVESSRLGLLALGDPPESGDSLAAWRSERIEVMLATAYGCYWRNEPQIMRRILEEIRPVVEQHGTVHQRIQHLEHLNSLLLREQRYLLNNEHLETIEKAYRLATEYGDNSLLVEVGFLRAFDYLWANRLEEAAASFAEMDRLAEKTGNMVWGTRILTYMTINERRMGRVEAVERLIPRCLDLSQRTQTMEYMALAQANVAWVCWKRGDLPGFDQAMERVKSVDAPYLPMEWIALLPAIDVELARGRLAQAVEHARTILLPRQKRLEEPLTQALSNAIAHWEAGQSDKAAAALREGLRLAAEIRYI